MIRIEKKLTQTKKELADIEQGKEVIGVDEEILDHLTSEQKETNFKKQLNQQYHRASIVIGTSESFWYQKNDQNYLHMGATTTTTTGSESGTMKSRRQSEISPSSSSWNNDRNIDNNSNTKTPYSPMSSPSISGSSVDNNNSPCKTPNYLPFNSLLTTESKSPSIPPSSSSNNEFFTPSSQQNKKISSLFNHIDHDDDDDHNNTNHHSNEDYLNDISPLTYQTNMMGLDLKQTPNYLSFQMKDYQINEEENDGDNEQEEEEGNEEEEDDDDEDGNSDDR